MRIVATVVFWLAAVAANAVDVDSLSADTLTAQLSGDNQSVRKKDIFHRIGDFFTRYFRDFNETDTTYIESQHYNFAFMMQKAKEMKLI